MVCSACMSGTLKTDIPKGTVSTIHNLKTYIAKPETTPKGLIVIIPDAFGWSMPNNRLLADQYARDGGYLVYVPDFMNGKSPSIKYSRSSYNLPHQLIPRFRKRSAIFHAINNGHAHDTSLRPTFQITIFMG